jgi:hypothetical protein
MYTHHIPIGIFWKYFRKCYCKLLFLFKEKEKKDIKQFQLQKKATEKCGCQINDGDWSIVDQMTVIRQPKFSLVEKKIKIATTKNLWSSQSWFSVVTIGEINFFLSAFLWWPNHFQLPSMRGQLKWIKKILASVLAHQDCHWHDARCKIGTSRPFSQPCFFYLKKYNKSNVRGAYHKPMNNISLFSFLTNI